MLPPFRPVLSVTKPRQSSGDQDRTLWGDFRGGDREALGKIYQRHLSGMYQHGLFYCKDPDLVRDCMQELFSRLWTRRKRISDADCVKAYLYKSLERILVVQIVRNRKRAVPLENSIDPREINGSFEQITMEREFRKEQTARIRVGLQSLTRSQREVVVLRYFNGLTYPQISEIMDIGVDSVYNLMSKAIEQLRNEVQIAA